MLFEWVVVILGYEVLRCETVTNRHGYKTGISNTICQVCPHRGKHVDGFYCKKNDMKKGEIVLIRKKQRY